MAFVIASAATGEVRRNEADSIHRACHGEQRLEVVYQNVFPSGEVFSTYDATVVSECF